MGPGAPLQARPVDMGLPSGLQWATCNIGAERPSDIGYYFSWGNTEGHAKDSGYVFSQVVYETTPAAEITDNLSLSQDAARANLGDPWRMPTADEFQELYDNCTNVWTSLNGMNGLLFISNVNGNKLFFPAAGYYNGKPLYVYKLGGYYWSSTYVSAANAKCLDSDNSRVDPQFSGRRRCGFSVRAVCPP